MSTLETARRLREVIALLVRRFRSGDAGVGGIPWSHAAVLEILDREGDLTAAEIAAAQSIRPQTAGPLLDVLEREGLVVRSPHESDRRKRQVALSKKGRRALRAGRAAREEWLARAIARSLTKDEQRVLHEAVLLLERVAQAGTK